MTTPLSASPLADLARVGDHLAAVAAYAADVLTGLPDRCTLGEPGRQVPAWPEHPLGVVSNASPGVRLAAPVRLNVVCFTTDRDPDAVRADLDARGRVFLTPTVLNGVRCLRAAFSNWRTTDADVDLALSEVAAACRE